MLAKILREFLAVSVLPATSRVDLLGGLGASDAVSKSGSSWTLTSSSLKGVVPDISNWLYFFQTVNNSR